MWNTRFWPRKLGRNSRVTCRVECPRTTRRWCRATIQNTCQRSSLPASTSKSALKRSISFYFFFCKFSNFVKLSKRILKLNKIRIRLIIRFDNWFSNAILPENSKELISEHGLVELRGLQRESYQAEAWGQERGRSGRKLARNIRWKIQYAWIYGR